MADVIIVPGRGVYPDGSLFKDSQARVQKAVELYKQGTAPKIIMSGGVSNHVGNKAETIEAKAMKKYAVVLGVEAADVLEESESANTIGNAYFSKKVYCEPNGWSDILIVASREHMKRVRYVFKKTFGDAYTLCFEESKKVINPLQYLRQLIHESISMKLTRSRLNSIDDGDDDTIRDEVLTK